MDENIQDKIRKGTTTLGIACRDGVVLAADKRVTAGYTLVNKKIDKVIVINDNLAVTFAGSVSEIQLLVKILKAQTKLDEIRRGKQLSTKETANVLAGIVYNNIRKFSPIIAITGFLLGGKDIKGFHLYNIGVDGSAIEYNDYTVDGAGEELALGVLESDYKPNISVEEGIKLAQKAIMVAIQRNIGTGDGYDIVTITAKGAKKVITKELTIRA